MPAGTLIRQFANLRRTLITAARFARTRMLPATPFLLAIFAGTDAFAGTPVVNTVEAHAAAKGAGQELHIRLNAPMSYVTHAPSHRGQTLQIRLRPVTVGVTGDIEFDGRSIHSWNPTQDVPLTDVQYEGNHPVGPTLVLRFTRSVTYTVRSGRDLRSIVVTIGTGAARTKTPGAQPPPSVAPPVPPRRTVAGTGGSRGLPEGGLAKLMDEAKIAMTAKDYQRAVLLYTKVLEYPDEPMHRQAQELIGLARERSGQPAHAKAEYEAYLKLYPEGEDSDRVRQRLAGLLTARSAPQKKLRATPTQEDKWDTQIYGGFSQYYAHDASSVDGQEEIVSRSDLNSDLDLSMRARSADYEFGARFNGGYMFDFREGGEDDSRISTAYFEAIDREHGLSTRVGRQSRSTGGILGRFDGAVLDVQIVSRARLSLAGGYPVESSSELEVDPDRSFYGAALDLGTFADKWDISLYGINQEVDGIVDRRAVGGEIRYYDAGQSFFSLVDYDVSYHELNIAILSANWALENRATVGFTVDYRNSPSLATTNALQGQGVEEVSDLLATLTEEEVRALAKDRTARSKSATLSASYPLGESFQISGDVTVTNLSGTRASGGVPETPGTGTEFYYSAQLIGNGLLMEGDSNILGLRYSDTSNTNTTTFSFDARYPATRNWRLNPRLRADYKQNKTDEGEQLRVRPSLRTDYRPRDWLRLDLEAGMEWTEDRIPGDATTTIGYNFLLGYRVNF